MLEGYKKCKRDSEWNKGHSSSNVEVLCEVRSYRVYCTFVGWFHVAPPPWKLQEEKESTQK